MKKWWYTTVLGWLLWALPVSAQGPGQIARINRSLWPYEINSARAFDFASKMEMLVFIEVLQQHEKLTQEDSLKKRLGLQEISISSIQTWKGELKNNLLANFGALSGTSGNDFIRIALPLTWQGLITAAGSLENRMPQPLKAWYAGAKTFYTSYLYEQMRLAALFPRVTSEILTLHRSEITGSSFKDKQFLLTFDDGPTLANGNTDKLVATLNQHHIPGIFFILGDRFNVRLKATSPEKLQDLYGFNVVGSHGKTHVSHQKSESWQYSLSFSAHLIDSILPTNRTTLFFRPPYGQRNTQLVSYLNQHQGQVMLWNIDSQDWSAKISSQEVADRMITLMLLWRRGILLFHDIHPKANEALPLIWGKLSASGIKWIDPRQL